MNNILSLMGELLELEEYIKAQQVLLKKPHVNKKLICQEIDKAQNRIGQINAEMAQEQT